MSMLKLLVKDRKVIKDSGRRLPGFVLISNALHLAQAGWDALSRCPKSGQGGVGVRLFEPWMLEKDWMIPNSWRSGRWRILKILVLLTLFVKITIVPAPPPEVDNVFFDPLIEDEEELEQSNMSSAESRPEPNNTQYSQPADALQLPWESKLVNGLFKSTSLPAARDSSNR